MGGGILTENSAAFAALSTEIRGLAERPELRYVQVRGGEMEGEASAITPTVHTIVPTSRSVEELWASLNGKARNSVRQLQREELKVRLETSGERLREFYPLYAAHMRELGSPVFGQRTLPAMLRHLGPERLRFFLLSHFGQPIGGMLCIVHGDRLTNQYSIVRRLGAPKNANYLLYWHVIEHAARNGIREFDLGRSTPQSGVHRFKQKWGGSDREVPYRLYTGSHRKSEARGIWSGTSDFGLMQRMWSKLPLAVCNAIGPVVRRELPFL